MSVVAVIKQKNEVIMLSDSSITIEGNTSYSLSSETAKVVKTKKNGYIYGFGFVGEIEYKQEFMNTFHSINKAKAPVNILKDTIDRFKENNEGVDCDVIVAVGGKIYVLSCNSGSLFSIADDFYTIGYGADFLRGVYYMTKRQELNQYEDIFKDAVDYLSRVSQYILPPLIIISIPNERENDI